MCFAQINCVFNNTPTYDLKHTEGLIKGCDAQSYKKILLQAWLQDGKEWKEPQEGQGAGPRCPQEAWGGSTVAPLTFPPAPVPSSPPCQPSPTTTVKCPVPPSLTVDPWSPHLYRGQVKCGLYSRQVYQYSYLYCPNLDLNSTFLSYDWNNQASVVHQGDEEVLFYRSAADDTSAVIDRD